MNKSAIPSIMLSTLRLPPVRMQSLSQNAEGVRSRTPRQPSLTLESGFYFLLETGGKILLENNNQ